MLLVFLWQSDKKNILVEFARITCSEKRIREGKYNSEVAEKKLFFKPTPAISYKQTYGLLVAHETAVSVT